MLRERNTGTRLLASMTRYRISNTVFSTGLVITSITGWIITRITGLVVTSITGLNITSITSITSIFTSITVAVQFRTLTSFITINITTRLNGHSYSRCGYSGHSYSRHSYSGRIISITAALTDNSKG